LALSAIGHRLRPSLTGHDLPVMEAPDSPS